MALGWCDGQRTVVVGFRGEKEGTHYTSLLQIGNFLKLVMVYIVISLVVACHFVHSSLGILSKFPLWLVVVDSFAKSRFSF